MMLGFDAFCRKDCFLKRESGRMGAKRKAGSQSLLCNVGSGFIRSAGKLHLLGNGRNA